MASVTLYCCQRPSHNSLWIVNPIRQEKRFFTWEYYRRTFVAEQFITLLRQRAPGRGGNASAKQNYIRIVFNYYVPYDPTWHLFFINESQLSPRQLNVHGQLLPISWSRLEKRGHALMAKFVVNQSELSSPRRLRKSSCALSFRRLFNWWIIDEASGRVNRLMAS